MCHVIEIFDGVFLYHLSSLLKSLCQHLNQFSSMIPSLYPPTLHAIILGQPPTIQSNQGRPPLDDLHNGRLLIFICMLLWLLQLYLT